VKLIIFTFVILCAALPVKSLGQESDKSQSDSIEIFIIDSYVPPENPNRFILSFYTSEVCKSKLIIENSIEYPISNELIDNHRTEIDLAKIKGKKNKLSYKILVKDANGKKSMSEGYDLDFHTSEEIIETKSNYLFTCLTGGIVFLTPSVTAIQSGGKTYYGFNKELPVLSVFSGGFNYPSGYFAVEYAHILKAERKNYFRVGYKHIYEIPKIEYLSVGLSGFSDFRGYNGLSPELSFGLVKIYNVFTLYSRYRYNFSPGKNASHFSEISLGLYSSFFTLHW